MKALPRALEDFDDFRVLGRDLSAHPGFTLTSVVKNEMFFLPAFLAHYRALGVRRFVFLDDRSTDGTRQYLLEQPEGMVLGSGRRFGDIVSLDHPVADYVASFHLQRPGVQSRIAAWEAGLEGFAARPVLGWGRENFGTVFGRYASGYGAVTEPHDNAHSKVMEVAATTGALGLLAWLALWASAFLVLWRAARAMEACERALAVFAAAALFGGLVQSLVLFDTAVGVLQSMLLLGFAVSPETVAVPEPRRPQMPARIALGAVAVALAATGLAVNHAIYSAADVSHLPRRDGSWREMAGGIDGFRPLANTWRWWLFNELGLHGPRILAEDGARARGLLEWAGREAEEAVRTEPGDWRIAHSLARMYRAAAESHSEYGAQARHYIERGRDLAPNRTVFPSALEPPQGLEVRELNDGGHELRWRWSEGAGHIVVSASRDGEPWRHILHAYDPTRTSFVLPGPKSPGNWYYRIKACRYPGACSTAAAWPPIVVPGAGRGSTP